MSRDGAVAIFGSSQTSPTSREWSNAEKAGARCAEAGLAVITGGYGGTMEAASRGASLSGGRVIGVTAPDLFPSRSGANRYVTEEIVTKTLSERIGVLTDLADGAIVLPGSIGTAAELVVAWNTNNIARRAGAARFPTVAVGQAWEDFWRLVTNRLDTDSGDIHIALEAEEAVDWLLSQPEIRRIRTGVVSLSFP